MQNNEQEKVERIYKTAVGRGESMGLALEGIFRFFGFDLALIAQYGALAMDVDTGPEVEALRRFNPKTLFISEPLNSIEGRDESDKQARLETYSRLRGDLDLRVLDVPSYEAIHLLSEPPKQIVGLVTQLRPFPYGYTHNFASMLIQDAPEILAPGGIMLVGTHDVSVNEVLEETAQSLNGKDIAGLSIRFVRDVPGVLRSAGRSFLAAQKS